MTPNELNSTMAIEVNEKHASATEDEIQETRNSTKSEDSGKIEDEQMTTTAEACSDSPEDRPGKNVEIEEGIFSATKSEPEYPTGIRFVLLTISLMLGVYMVALDTSIICKSLEPPQPRTTVLTWDEQPQPQASRHNSTQSPT
jgi:hypothetical protein